MIKINLDSINFLKTDEKIKDVQSNISLVLEKSATLFNSQIQQRVQTLGQDAKGNLLKKYSKQYSKFRSSKGEQIAYRDLTFSGQMFGSLTVLAKKNSAKMYFYGAENAKKAYFNNKRTKFFELSVKQKDYLKSEFENLLKK